MSKDIKIGISDYKVSKNPDRLITLGLGSCVGIAIYDKSTKIGGLSHIMFPDSELFTKNIKIEKFANLAIPKMIEEINNRSTRNLIAKIAGGASMFNFTDNNLVGSIGNRNVQAVEKILKDLKIPILGKEVGGKIGRTMIVNLEDFSVHIKTVNKNVIDI